MTTFKTATSEISPPAHREAMLARAALEMPAIQNSVSLTEAGIQIGAGSVLVRMRKGADGRLHLALEADTGRLLALLAVAEGHPVSAHRVIPALDAAAAHWQRGDRALANLRLVFADLPRLREPADAYRVGLAEHLLDAGMAPDALMQALWPYAALDKYRADEARISAGQTSAGEWTSGDSGTARPSADEGRIVVAGKPLPPGEGEKEIEQGRRSGRATIEDDLATGRGVELTEPLPVGIGPGPFAGRSIPAGPSPRPMQWQQREVTVIGNETGCHTCGTKDPGTLRGNFYCDHQPPTALKSPDEEQVYFPHCKACSCAQGGRLQNYLRNRR